MLDPRAVRAGVPPSIRPKPYMAQPLRRKAELEKALDAITRSYEGPLEVNNLERGFTAGAGCASKISAIRSPSTFIRRSRASSNRSIALPVTRRGSAVALRLTRPIAQKR
jgi:hypothetical protein